MVAVGFSGGDGQQQGSGKVAGEKRQGHRCNNQIKVTAVVAAAAAALNSSDGQWLGGGQHDKREECRRPSRYVPYKGTFVPYDGTFGAPD
jgi:hypothetical protein